MSKRSDTFLHRLTALLTLWASVFATLVPTHVSTWYSSGSVRDIDEGGYEVALVEQNLIRVFDRGVGTAEPQRF